MKNGPYLKTTMTSNHNKNFVQLHPPRGVLKIHYFTSVGPIWARTSSRFGTMVISGLTFFYIFGLMGMSLPVRIFALKFEWLKGVWQPWGQAKHSCIELFETTQNKVKVPWSCKQGRSWDQWLINTVSANEFDTYAIKLGVFRTLGGLLHSSKFK